MIVGFLETKGENIVETMPTNGGMEENITNVALKEEPNERMISACYIDEICSSTFGKVFFPIDNNDVDFTDEMVKLDLEGQSSSQNNWVSHTAGTSSLSFKSSPQRSVNSPEKSKEKDSNAPAVTTLEKNTLESEIAAASTEQTPQHQDNSAANQSPKFYKIQCSICKKWFLNNDSMIAHLRTHSTIQSDEIYQDSPHRSLNPNIPGPSLPLLSCELCEKSFFYKHCLRNHLQAHVAKSSPPTCTCCSTNYSLIKNPDGKIACEVCRIKCGDKIIDNNKLDLREMDNLNNHQIVGGLKAFCCDLCPRSFGQKTALNNHMLSHSGEKPHACSVCEKTYKRKSELIRHTMVHTGERPYECKECLMTFREKAKLNSHMLVHTGEKKYECNLCNKACARKSDLNSHMLSHTGGQYDCKICEKIFTRKSDLNRHILIHTGEKPFACDLCDMAFRERTRLNSHMIIHTGDKRHVCHICGKKFGDKSSLKKHMIIHTGDRPYECFICKKTFTQKSTLNSHVLVHTGERAFGPYECGNCPETFGDKDSLRKHWLVHISEMNDDEGVIEGNKNSASEVYGERA